MSHLRRDQALAFCAGAKARDLEFRATSLSTLAQMVAGGAGVTLLPKMAVPLEGKRANLKVRPLAKSAPARSIALVWRKGFHLAQAMQELAGIARRAYSKLAS